MSQTESGVAEQRIGMSIRAMESLSRLLASGAKNLKVTTIVHSSPWSVMLKCIQDNMGRRRVMEKPMDKRGKLDEEVFTYKMTKDKKVFISWHGKHVTTLSGHKAEDFIVDIENTDGKEAQLIMAKFEGGGSAVSMIHRPDNVKQQYADDKNLAARAGLHAKHSTNKQGWVPWLFERYRFSENDSILELGCGNGGSWEGRLERLPRGCTLVLSDLSEGMVAAAEKRFSSCHDGVSFRQIDIQAIPFGGESFDVILAHHMLYHVPDLGRALSEVRRVLKPGGRFYAATNGSGGLSLFLHNALKKFDPETQAFTQECSFTLQRGGEILSRYFPLVQRLDYEDSLAVTETRDLMAWMESTRSMSGYGGENAQELYDYFEAVRAKDGAIHIPKEVGLFVCEKRAGSPG